MQTGAGWTPHCLGEMGHDMRKDWIVDVLADLKAFAEHNGLEATAAGLEDAALVAVAEIASRGARRLVADPEGAAPEHRVSGGNVTELFGFRGHA